MTKTIVLALPGTGHPNGGDQITECFLSEFDSEHFDTRIVPYAAAFGGRDMPFAESRVTGRKALIAALDELGHGTPVVLSGYSQGAVIAGDLGLEIREDNLDYNIKAVALIADGFRPRGVGVMPGPMIPETVGYVPPVTEGYGIMGQRTIPNDRFPTFWVSAWGDPIAALPGGNPLRGIADVVEWYSIRSAADTCTWGARVLDRALQGRIQDWWNPANWGRWNSAIGFARGYLFESKHTNNYVTHGYTHALARAVTDHLAK